MADSTDGLETGFTFLRSNEPPEEESRPLHNPYAYTLLCCRSPQKRRIGHSGLPSKELLEESRTRYEEPKSYG